MKKERCVKEKVISEYVIQKSRFITYLFNIKNNNQAKEYIDIIKKENIDATHVVYAYILENDSRSNDDNEPKGTAGLPTLEVLRKENLINTLAITVRYFGGIKLGASGLLRAYSKSVSDALKKATFSEINNVSYLKLVLSYRDSSSFDKLFNDYINIDKSFDEKVTYIIKILTSNVEILKKNFLSFKDEYYYELIKVEDEFI